MINQPENIPFEIEQRIRQLTVLFVVDAISEPLICADGSTSPPNPQGALAYIIQHLCDNDPAKFHIITRAAWSAYVTTGETSRWKCIHDAAKFFK